MAPPAWVPGAALNGILELNAAHSDKPLQASLRWSQRATQCWPSWPTCPFGEPAVACSAGLWMPGWCMGLAWSWARLGLLAQERPGLCLVGACMPCPGPTLRSPTCTLSSSKVPGVGKVTQKMLEKRVAELEKMLEAATKARRNAKP